MASLKSKWAEAYYYWPEYWGCHWKQTPLPVRASLSVFSKKHRKPNHWPQSLCPPIPSSTGWAPVRSGNRCGPTRLNRLVPPPQRDYKTHTKSHTEQKRIQIQTQKEDFRGNRVRNLADPIPRVPPVTSAVKPLRDHRAFPELTPASAIFEFGLALNLAVSNHKL